MGKKEWGYVMKDSLFGGYDGRLGLIKNTDGKTKWSYYSYKNVFRWHGNKELALAKIERLKKLNEIAQIPGLTWELVYTDIYSIPHIDDNLYSRFEEIEYDIPRGCICKQRKAVKEICNKYKVIFKDIEREWRQKQAV